MLKEKREAVIGRSFKNIPLGVCIRVITLGIKKFFLEFKSQGSARHNGFTMELTTPN